MTTARWVANPDARAWRCGPLPDGVRAFHASLPAYAPTPLVELPAVAAELGVGRVFVKDESARLGLPAFKALGATWAVHRALAAQVADEPAAAGRPVTLVCATDGNHGRAVARTAALLGHRARVWIAPGVHPAAVAAIAAEGADVLQGATSYDDAVARAARAAAEPDTILVQDMGWPGYEEIPAWIVEGYATLCAEVDEQLAMAGAGGPDLVAVPVGVGSLAHAVVAYWRGRATGDPSPALVSVEPVAAACLLGSLARGELTTVETGETIMAGLNCGTPTGLGWPLLRDGLDAAIAIDDDACRDALRTLAGAGLLVGPCGGAALAGVRAAFTGEGAEVRRAALGIDGAAVVVLLATEGAEANPLG